MISKGNMSLSHDDHFIIAIDDKIICHRSIVITLLLLELLRLYGTEALH